MKLKAILLAAMVSAVTPAHAATLKELASVPADCANVSAACAPRLAQQLRTLEQHLGKKNTFAEFMLMRADSGLCAVAAKSVDGQVANIGVVWNYVATHSKEWAVKMPKEIRAGIIAELSKKGINNPTPAQIDTHIKENIADLPQKLLKCESRITGGLMMLQGGLKDPAIQALRDILTFVALGLDEGKTDAVGAGKALLGVMHTAAE